MADQWMNWERVSPSEPRLGYNIRRLRKEGHHVFILTYRNPESHQYVPQWLEAVGIKYDALLFTSTPIMPKSEFPMDVWIDDDPVAWYREAQGHIYVPKRPWNSWTALICEGTENLTRVKSVEDAVDHILWSA